MTEEIPNSIKENFTIISENIKYPKYPDEEFQQSISEEENINNYSAENTQKAFNDFFKIYQSCKDKVFDIISNNLHNIQEYSRSLNEKSINYVFYFYLFEKFAKLLEMKYYNNNIKENKELFCDDIIYNCIYNINNKLSIAYKNDYNDQNEISKLKQEFNPIIEKYNKLLKSKNEIGNILIRTIKFLTKYIFVPFEQELIKFQNIKIFFENNYFKTNNNEENEIVMLNIILYLKNIKILEFAFYNSAIMDINDICNLEEKSKEWNDLKKILFRVIPKNLEQIKNENPDKKRNTDIFTAVMSNIPIESDNETLTATSLIFSGLKNFIYYKTNENKAKIDSIKYQLKNNYEHLPEYFKLFSTKFKPIISKFMPNIEFRRKIYVKKELPNLNRNYIEKLIYFMNGEDLPIDSNIKDNINESLPILFKDKVPDKTIKRNYVSVTILNNKKLYFKNEKKEEGFLSSIINKFKNNDNNDNNIIQINNEFRKNTIMIAIHGGGFMSSSTFLHERYLRKWIKEIDIPIFGINYSLAPKYKYPEAINDVYQAYIWILNHAKEELNMDIKHIILYGDSAGGNIILSLNSILIVLKEYDIKLKNKIILPELLLPFYPVTYLNYNSYSNSMLLSLCEQMLNPNIMKYMLEQYLNEYKLIDKDPFLNPILYNKYILDRMNNKIRIFFGTNDNLRDDSIKLLYLFSKYNNNNNNHKIDIRGYDILSLDHGFNGKGENGQLISRNLLIPEINEFLKNII